MSPLHYHSVFSLDVGQYVLHKATCAKAAVSTDERWDVETARLHYRIPVWGRGLFDVNAAGRVVANAGSAQLDLYELSKQLKRQGIGLPVLVRFPHILQHLLGDLYAAFERAALACGYAGRYVAAYPVKVNQQASVIRHFDSQTQWPVAFEVGSKAELIGCLGVLRKQSQTIICNGYKDEAYIRLAFIGRLLGNEVIIVLEDLDEFQHVLKLSAQFDLQPMLGMRVRLSSIAAGKWQNTGGEHSKFGLTTNRVLQLVKQLREHKATAWMRMLHFHMGSQIPSIRHIRAGVEEGARYFLELRELGIELTQLNVGGGLAIDYEGGGSNTYFSMDYSIEEYANAVVGTIDSTCRQKGIQPPTIFSENGRAMTAPHALLITNVVSAEYQRGCTYEDGMRLLRNCPVGNRKLTALIDLSRRVLSIGKSVGGAVNSSRCYAELVQVMREVQRDFSAGIVTLEEKAWAEKLVRVVYRQLLNVGDHQRTEYTKEIEERFVDKYFCNFSLFRSTPDIWGLNQIFPIIPLHRLREFPSHKVRLHDLTCDSDGQIRYYVEDDSIKSYLSLHEFHSRQDYMLGVFLVGAYQEILGDMHNLFGDTCAVNVTLNSDGSYRIYANQPGSTIEEILSRVRIGSADMRRTWLEKLARANVLEETKKLALQELELSLKSDSYLS